jgi:hypothetical protein
MSKHEVTKEDIEGVVNVWAKLLGYKFKDKEINILCDSLLMICR